MVFSVVTAGCDTEVIPKEKAAVISLRVVAPGLWPPTSAQRVIVRRGLSGDLGEVVAEYSQPPTPLTVTPHLDVTAWLGVEIVDAAGQLVAAGRTPLLIVRSDDGDREIVIFLAAKGGAHPLVGVDSSPVVLPARIGSTATALPDGSVIIAGGGEPGQSAGKEAGAELSPCKIGVPSAQVASIMRLDPHQHALTELSKLKTPRAFHGAAALPGNRVAFVGGYQGTAASKAVSVLSANQGTLKSAAFGLSVARVGPCVVAVGGRLVVIGGQGAAAGTAELWDQGSGTLASVSLGGQFEAPSCEAAVDPVSGAQWVFVLGGKSGPLGSFDVVLAVDGSKLTLVGQLPAASPAATFEALAVTQAPFGVLRAGGLTPGSAMADVRWLALDGSSYKSVAKLSEARGCSARGVVGRTLVIAGGTPGKGQSAALDLVDLADRTVRSVALPAARSGGWVVPLSSGAALVGGGTADGLVLTLP
ncbi:MAG: hypothetical protein KC502_05445 [Myxococcales bacterium]|nr:hypothetical protein [Myxococcales bacterium]